MESTHTVKLPIIFASSWNKLSQITRSYDYNYKIISIHSLSFPFFLLQVSLPGMKKPTQHQTLGYSQSPKSLSNHSIPCSPHSTLFAVCWHCTGLSRWKQWGSSWCCAWKAWDAFNYVHISFWRSPLPRALLYSISNISMLIWSRLRLAGSKDRTIYPTTSKIQRITLQIAGCILTALCSEWKSQCQHKNGRRSNENDWNKLHFRSQGRFWKHFSTMWTTMKNLSATISGIINLFFNMPIL